MYQAGLVLEGGGMRGLFTAGVLDYFIDLGMEFQEVYGVSAGICNACSYLSKQRGRSLRVNTDYLEGPRYCSVESLIRPEICSERICFTESYRMSWTRMTMRRFQKYPGGRMQVVTNCETGKQNICGFAGWTRTYRR